MHFNKVDHARTLLSQGVDVNSSGCDTNGMKHALPLVVALRHKNDMLVDLFLKEGSAAIPEQVYRTMLHTARCEYPPHLISSLLQADEFVEWAMMVQGIGPKFIDISHLFNQDRYREHQVTEDDLLVVIRRLVQIGHDLSSDQFFLMVASAVSRGHFSLLKYLFSINAPIPSRILFAEEIAPLIRDLTLQGIDIRAIAAKGDAALHQVLARCPGGSRCWVLDCFKCLASRSALLTTLGCEVR